MTAVRAVVVAVEDFHGRHVLPPLSGPAADAARFVAWLRARRVPDASMTLVASPLPANRAVIDGIGLPVRPALQSVLHDLLTREVPADEADLLMVFWGGHGVVDGQGRRRLFYADATADDKRNLDFDELTTALRTSYFPRPRHQLLIADACGRRRGRGGATIQSSCRRARRILRPASRAPAPGVSSRAMP